ncbi:S8 family serine peptidase [Mucilaginibacter sp. RS28]|uniref:S8 family serine peptidase n=1 Tax=Mucilaginibacter straminoryzae TaxID=2932774 RepID=A0A9X2B9E2_9SPHI|nr:S8 family serine peptidase [Mucilaginibacter straminoryzae]MCJ8210376.1 S8 family serine peptidase [Mucilaginibacter straminoryzae]
MIFLFNTASAQKPLVSEARKAELQSLSKQYDKLYQADKSQFSSLAKRHNWQLKRKRKDGGVVALHRINSLGFPMFIRTDNNTTAAATTRTNLVQPGGSLNLNLSGSSTTLNNKLAIWDGGAVLANHQEFAGKTVTLKNNVAADPHSTHVAGTMIAKGVYAPAKGMAPGANTLLSYDFNNDVTEMTTAASGLLLSNHSYGEIAGWDYDDTNSRWQWYGLPGDTVDYNFGFYDQQAQAWDKIAYTAPYYLIVESSGNSRAYSGPEVGQDYWGYKSRTDQTFVDKGARPANISSNNGYDIISDYANAKNILTVGAVNPLPFGPSRRSDISIAFFSSWGPTDDGRIKPDICGMGVNVLSTGSTSTTSYITLSGTSMAAPNVTGSLYLLQEYYSKLNSGAFMKSATLKGLACATAFDAGNIGPDYIYGWGLLDMQKATQAITDNGTKSLIKENTLAQGQTQTFKVVASGNGPLISTICWTDPQGTPSADGVINDRNPKLVNDLDIRVSDGTNTLMPWVLNPDKPGLAATNGDNIRDNIEQVYIEGAVPGKTYTITVTHKKTLSASQDYSLIVTGAGGNAYCASAPLSSADSRINNFTLSNINNTPGPGCTTYSDYTSQTIQLEPGKSYPLSLTLGTCGNNFDKIAKVFADWNGDGDFDDAGELIATSGAIAATGSYNANITVPAGVTIGNYTLLRVVLSETNDATTILPCGTYAKGETQDYRVLFVQPAIDAGITAVNGSTAAGACAGKTSLTVSIRNYGTSALTSVPLTLTVTDAANNVTTFNETFTGNIAAGAQADYTLTNTVITAPGGSYTITAIANVAGDLVTTNNQASSTLVVGALPAATNLTAYYCSDTQSYQLSGNGNGGQLLWYQNQGDKLPVAVGSPASTTTAPVNNTYYAGINDFSGKVGPSAKTAFTGGGYNQFTPSVKVYTAIPVVLQSAKLYIGNAGKITFSASDSTGQIVSAVTINATLTRSTAVAGAAADDAADQGKVFDLNLVLPHAGNYTIDISFDDNATIYRSNAGVTGYPFSIGNIFKITDNTASPNSTSYYYYFYDLQVVSYGCASATRQAVTISKPTITRNGNVLTSSATSGNQWYYNGAPITGETGQTLSPKQSGNYQVGVAQSTSCLVLSDNFSFALTALHPDNSTDIGLTIFPVPAKNDLTVIFTAKEQATVTMAFINPAGQTLYKETGTASAGPYSKVVNTSALPPGSYVLKLTLGDKVYAKRMIIVR